MNRRKILLIYRIDVSNSNDEYGKTEINIQILKGITIYLPRKVE